MNIDEYLDLHDQTETNLLSNEEVSTIQSDDAEWHSATSIQDHDNNNGNGTAVPNDPLLDEMLLAAAATVNNGHPYLFSNNSSNEKEDGSGPDDNNWGLLQTISTIGFDRAHTTQLIADGGIHVLENGNSFVAPDFLLKTQHPPAVAEEDDNNKRITRSTRSTAQEKVNDENKVEKKPKNNNKKNTRAKKLYCVCQQPYNGKPMVQCDHCKEWFHCTCVDFDPETQEEEIDWVCNTCLEAKGKEETEPKEPETPLQEQQEQQEKETVAHTHVPTLGTTTRQTRSRNQSKCLYAPCGTHTRADSYCSDVCARKDKEPITAPELKEEPQTNTTRRSRMKNSALSIATSSKTKITSSPEQKEQEPETVEEQANSKEEKKGDEEEELHDSHDEGTNTPATPSSPSQMTLEENPVRRNVIKSMSTLLKSIIDTAVQENPELFDADDESTLTTAERAEKISKAIEHTMLEHLGDVGKTQKSLRTCGETYKSKFRSLLYNLRDKANTMFQLSVASGSLTPEELIKMSSEDMANPELKNMSEVLREKALKNSIMKISNAPIIKKTHKGDIIMIPNKDNDTSHKNMYSEQDRSDMSRPEHVDGSLDHSGNSSPIKTEVEKFTAPTSFSSFSPMTKADADEEIDPLDDILARIGIPTSHEEKKRTSSTTEELEAKKRRVALDVEKLLGEEDDTPFQVEEVNTSQLTQEEGDDNDGQEKEEDTEMLDEPYDPEAVAEPTQLPTIWRGHVNMPQVAEFEACARQIGGRPLSDNEWEDVLSPTLWVEGRIPADRVTDYVTQTQYSHSREIVLLEIEASVFGTLDQKASNESQAQTLLKYFDSRERYAVVGHNKTKTKDFYLIPLYKTQNIPDCLYVVRVEETKRVCDLFLGVLILAKQPSSATVVSNSSSKRSSVAEAYSPTTAVAPTNNTPAVTEAYHPEEYNPPAETYDPFAAPALPSSHHHHQPPQQSYPYQQSSYGYQQQQQQQQQSEYGYGHRSHHHHNSRNNNRNNNYQQQGYNNNSRNSSRYSNRRPSY